MRGETVCCGNTNVIILASMDACRNRTNHVILARIDVCRTICSGSTNVFVFSWPILHAIFALFGDLRLCDDIVLHQTIITIVKGSMITEKL